MLKYNPKGMTLLEILMVIFLFNILMGSIYTIYNLSLASFEVGMSRAEIASQLRLALERLSQDIITASYISQDYPATIKIKADLDKDIPGEETYLYYLYNSQASWPLLTPQQESYHLKRALIDDGFNYGEGITILKNLPFTSIFKINPTSSTVNIQLVLTLDKESSKLQTTIFPRNLSL